MHFLIVENKSLASKGPAFSAENEGVGSITHTILCFEYISELSKSLGGQVLPTEQIYTIVVCVEPKHIIMWFASKGPSDIMMQKWRIFDGTNSCDLIDTFKAIVRTVDQAIV